MILSLQVKQTNKQVKDIIMANIKFNTLETYYEAGQKAGTAAKYNDWAAVNFHKRWFDRAVRLESGDHATQAQAAYNKGYKEA